MAQAMSYGLRVEPVLTRDGRDLMDQVSFRTILALHYHGIRGAAEDLRVTEATIRRRLRKLDERVGGKVYGSGKLTALGVELLEQMEGRTRQLEEQLEHLWKKPTLTCDGLVLKDGELLLVRRSKAPFKGAFALPGGIMEYGERACDCVVREVEEETGLRTEVLRLIGEYSDPGRDPRGHFITLLYELRVSEGELAGGDDAEYAGFFPLNELPPLAFDHAKLVSEALGGRPEHSL